MQGRLLFYRLFQRNGRGRKVATVTLSFFGVFFLLFMLYEPDRGYSFAEEDSSPSNILISIHTVPRRNASYLPRVLRSIRREFHIAESDNPRVRVMVLNHRPGSHPDFEAAKKEFETEEKPVFRFIDRNTIDPPSQCANNSCPGLWRPVTDTTVRMNHHIAEWLGETAIMCTDMVLLMEDDFELCDGFFSSMLRILRKVELIQSDFAAIRVSYGLNGVLLHCTDIPKIANYLQHNMKAGPADTLFGYLWTATQRVKDDAFIPDVSLFFNRSYFVVRNNIMNHIGHVSTRSQDDWKEEAKLRKPDTVLHYPKCDGILNFEGLYALESFNPEECNMPLCRRKNDVVIDSKEKIPRWVVKKFKYV
eukprot:TRINITY_DN6656_c0_g1_i2.p1 TRINITY_DN6656_c0_g1~~TRINITY_DN6656_c0_g1_i2.p1  ORF type:complete len:362 (-),score=63.96 TRINITY_DN6656_c0_g1_i2:388-1473(-)